MSVQRVGGKFFARQSPKRSPLHFRSYTFLHRSNETEHVSSPPLTFVLLSSLFVRALRELNVGAVGEARLAAVDEAAGDVQGPVQAGRVAPEVVVGRHLHKTPRYMVNS